MACRLVDTLYSIQQMSHLLSFQNILELMKTCRGMLWTS